MSVGASASYGRALLADGVSLSGVSLRQLFVGQCLVLALHLVWMPLWLVGLALAVAAWRYLQLRGRLPKAGRGVRLAGVAVLFGALWGEYGALRDMQSLIGVLLGVYLLKLLETDTRRDARVVVCVGFLALAAAFLHDQGVPMALAGLGVTAWLLNGLVWLAGAPDARRAWRETTWLLGLAAPLMVTLFVLFPRLPPLWSLPQFDRAATGLSDAVTPGAIAELTRSDRRAFRVRFQGAVPPPNERYWRVYTLSRFDGATWSRLSPQQWAAMLGTPVARFGQVGRVSSFAETANDAMRYRMELLLEPDSRPWRPTLGTPVRADTPQRFLADGTLEGLAPLTGRGLLTLEASARAPGYADRFALARLRELPPGNPRARALAERLWRDSAGDPRRYLEAVVGRFGEAPYRYTLTPPTLNGRARIDAFLFDSRAGYCTHYASATAWMARAVGIPARLVAGFLGGERHPDGYFTLRDYDAHAWVEVWLNGTWQRLDPTATIAPERIESGPQAVAGAGQAYLADAPLSPLQLRDIGWLNQARLAWERLEYRWQRSVIGYQAARQRETLAWLVERWRRLWAGVAALWPSTGWFGALLVAAGGAVVLGAAGGLGWRGWRRWRERTDVNASLRRLQAGLARRGYPEEAGESPASHLRRVAASWEEIGPLLRGAAEDAERLAYAPLDDDERHWRARRLGDAVRGLRRRRSRRRSS